MDWENCKLFAVDLSLHKVLLIDNQTGEIICRYDYPSAASPVFLGVHAANAKACYAVREKRGGSIFVLDANSPKSYRLPVDLPAPAQFTIDSAFKDAYFVSADSVVYHLDMRTLRLKAFAQPSDAVCVGIFLSEKKIYTAWETGGEGIIAAFSTDGDFLFEWKVAGIPTNLHVWRGQLFIPYTESKTYGEGLAVFEEGKPPAYLTFQAPAATRALHVYPCNVTIDESKNIAYVVNEDSGSITTVRLGDLSIGGYFTVGRSITNLHLLPDSRFAIATSNMFADLSMLDLVNQKLLSVTDRAQEFSNIIAVLA